jgi:8-oxo-dGTP pyrophosphatase MutT (NUDIX family)
MTSAFDDLNREEVLTVRRARGPAPRPRDAATLILVRRDGAEPRVLMGRRSGGHDFMPDKYVFPGGRVDPEDGRAPSGSELGADVAGKLAIGCRRVPRAFGLAAIRELQEETGLLLAAPGSGLRCPRSFGAFAREGVLPQLAPLKFLGRAITPPARHKRFDARFFMADAEEALLDLRPPAEGAELVDLRWVSLAETRELDLPSVTRFMLQELVDVLDTPDPARGAPLLRWSQAGHRLDRI